MWMGGWVVHPWVGHERGGFKKLPEVSGGEGGGVTDVHFMNHESTPLAITCGVAAQSFLVMRTDRPYFCASDGRRPHV